MSAAASTATNEVISYQFELDLSNLRNAESMLIRCRNNGNCIHFLLRFGSALFIES
jgi:hypothetical protein